MIAGKDIRIQFKSRWDAKKAHDDPGSFDLMQAQSHMATLGLSEVILKEDK
jgi:hypothetical protein